jgi:hypothetical protein
MLQPEHLHHGAVEQRLVELQREHEQRDLPLTCSSLSLRARFGAL